MMRNFVPYLIMALGLGLYGIYANPGLQDAIGDAATAVARPVVIPLVNLINAPSFVYIVSILILLAAVVVCVLYRLRAVRPRIGRLRAVREAVFALPVPSRWSREQSADAMRQLGDALRHAGVFPTAFARFQLQAAQERGIPAVPFGYFAASDPTTDEAERRGLMQALPGYFTWVGLILTFLGLVVALYFASRGFRSGSVEEARHAILQLLNAASFKFLTSVAALVGALLVSVTLRLSLIALRRETDETIAIIEGYVSAWRDAQASSQTAAEPLQALADRLDLLVTGLNGLTGRIDQALHRWSIEEARPIRDAAE